MSNQNNKAMKGIPEEEFDEVYKPQKNHLDDNASWDGCLYETFGEEEAYVRTLAQSGSKRVWTLVDDDEGNDCIVAGMHYVNRRGFLITEKEWEDEEAWVIVDNDFD